MHPLRFSFIGRFSDFLCATGLLLILPVISATAAVDFWVGKANSAGDITKPANYVQSIAPLILSQHHFDHLSSGQDLSVYDLGGFYFSVKPISAKVEARQGPVAGVQPVSDSLAVYIGASRNGTTQLWIDMIQPVNSLGFALMGVESSARLTVQGTVRETTCTIPPVATAGFRRWLGMCARDEEIRRICLEVQAGEDFGLDDLEIGRHAPEPGGLPLAMLLFTIWPKRRMNSGNPGRNP